MTFLDILKKKDKIQGDNAPAPETTQRNFAEEPPVFTFLRTDTHTQEVISPPSFSSADSHKQGPFSRDSDEKSLGRLSAGRSRSASASSQASDKSKTKTKRLSHLLHLRKSDPTSPNVPEDLPDITPVTGEEGEPGRESLWEKRATILALRNGQERSRPTSPVGGIVEDVEAFAKMARSTSNTVNPGVADGNIQEAIRLHEEGDLVNSTKIFGRLADPNGENDPLSQVLYGLALRYVKLFFQASSGLWLLLGCSHLDSLNSSDSDTSL